MPYEPRERRYIAEYMMQKYPNGGYQLNVPLGQVPDDITARYGVSAGAKLTRPSRPRIDAVAWTPKAYYLIEAKIREAKAAIGDLLVYKSLAEKTLDLPEYDGQPLEMWLVVPWALDWVLTAAHDHNMKVDIYLPSWVEQYVRDHQLYFTNEYRTAREEKIRQRQVFGLE